jgi:hypothetical protein
MSDMNVLPFATNPNGGTLITFDRCASAVPVRRAPAPSARALTDPEATLRALTRVDAASLDLAVAEFLAALAREGGLLERAAS